MTETIAKMCPYKLGPCWEHQCQLWKETIQDCGLKRFTPEDEAFGSLREQVDKANAFAKEMSEKADDALARIQQLESELADRPTKESWVAMGAKVQGYEADNTRLEKELTDARAELEALRAQGSKSSRRKEKPLEREP